MSGCSPLNNLTDLALDQSPEPLMITDADLTRSGGPQIIYVNHAMLKLTGYSRSELIGRSSNIFQGEDTDGKVAAQIIRRLIAEECVSETILNYTKDGKSFWNYITISPIRDDEGRVLAYLSVHHNLTQLHKVKNRHQWDTHLFSTGERIARFGTWSYGIEEDKVLWSNGSYEIWEWGHDTPPPSRTECINFIDQNDRPMMVGLLNACIKTQAPYQAEVRAHSSRGTPMRLKVLGEAVLGDNGKTAALVGAVRDITHEKRLEAELDETISQSREIEQYFAAARSIAKIGMFDYWIEHDRLHWSDELIEMAGLSPDLFPSKLEVFHSRIDPRDRQEYLQLREAALQDHKGFSKTLRFIRPDGKIIHMAIVADLQESVYGRRLVGIARNVTEDVEASQRLASEQERFQIIADTVSDVLWDFDLAQERFWATPNWPRKLGVDFDGTGVHPVEWLALITPEDREKVSGSVRQALDTGADRWDCEFRIADVHGTRAEVEIKSSILRNEHGEAYRILGNCRNVTVEKRQQEGFTRSRALEAVGQMTGGIAHDFNNLLMIIQGNAELLEMRGLDEDDADSVRLIMQASEAAANLTSRLLSFAGQSRLRSASVDAGKLVEDVAVLLRSGLTERISLLTTSETGLCPVEVDGIALEQAIINLTVNARDAMERQGGRVEIACQNVVVADEMVGAKAELAPGRYVCISVTDNGAGMDEQVKSRAFEPFFTTKDVGKGTGLGLSTVYGFARQSGGSLEIYSELGRGTTLNLYLPVSDMARIANEQVDLAVANIVGAGLRVLVVEDQPDVRRHVENVLISAGFDVTSANEGKSALALLEAGKSFDLLFTDIVMPGGMNGVQLAETAKTFLPQLRVLFTSGFPASAFDELGLQKSEDFVLLKKPYKRDELILALTNALHPKA